MEFLVEFQVNVPDGTPESGVKDRENAEASAAAKLADEGHLVRVWKTRGRTADLPLGGHPRPIAGPRRDRPRPPAHRVPDRRDIYRS